MNHDDLKAAAQRTYLKLKELFPKSHNFWRLGHSFDAIIDYFIVMNNNDGEAANFGKLALERYAATGGAWYDDYGWWGLANLKAAQQKHLFGDTADRFYANCVQGWERMAPCATTWDLAKSVSKFQAVKPAVDHGVWNHLYVADDNSIYNPLNPQPDPLAGYQNTVTNALYFVLAARLSRHPGIADSKYAEAMEHEYQFLKAWFNMSRPGMPALLNVYSDARDKAVVRERVGCYDSGAKVNGFRPDLAWTGDQGLIVGGLVERMATVKRESPDYNYMLSVVRQILAGTREYLAVDEILLPWWPDPAPGISVSLPRGDGEDYRTGIAVFMRYLLSAYLSNNEDLRKDFLPYTTFVYSNAEHVLQYPSPAEGKVDVAMVTLTNDLAILTAALVIA